MTRTFKTLALTLVAALFTLGANAQKENRKQGNPDEFGEKQAQRIADKLSLDDNTTAKFVETYTTYQKELRELRQQNDKKGQKNDTLRTDEEVESAIKAQFALKKKVLELRETYYSKYRAFLTPKQIERVYKLERQDRPTPPRQRGGNRPDDNDNNRPMRH